MTKKCPECGCEMREEDIAVGFAKECDEKPPLRKQYTCMNEKEKCSKANIPQIEWHE